jgi:hypothetical protein
MTPIIAELNRAASIAITGALALGIAWGALAYWAEPHFRAEALRNQEQVAIR